VVDGGQPGVDSRDTETSKGQIHILSATDKIYSQFYFSPSVFLLINSLLPKLDNYNNNSCVNI